MSLRLAAIPYAIPFRRPLVTAAAVLRERRGFWILVRDGEGRIGLGEAAPLPGFGTERLADVARALEEAGGRADLPQAPPTLRAGISLAMLDLEAQRAGRRVADLLSPRPRTRVAVNALIDAGDSAGAADQAAGAVARGYRTVKLKVAAASPEEDERRIAAVRERVGPAVRIRIDANGRWDLDTAVAILRRLERYGIEYVEQPVAVDLGKVRARTSVPVAADESVRSPDDARALISSRAVDVLILKPMALGDLAISRAIAREAAAAGLGVVVTSLLETPVGVAGALHLAASLDEADRACGIATVDLLEPTPARGLPAVADGSIELPASPGLGVSLEVPPPW